MRIHKNTYRLLKLFAVLGLCVLLGLTYGCSKSGKKEESKFKPGVDWLEGMRTRVDTVISDQAKKNDMLSLVTGVEQDLVALDRSIQKFYANMGKLKDNYEASRADYKKVIDGFEAERRQIADRITDSRFKMRDLSTREEWERLTWYGEGKGVYKQTVRQPGE